MNAPRTALPPSLEMETPVELHTRTGADFERNGQPNRNDNRPTTQQSRESAAMATKLLAMIAFNSGVASFEKTQERFAQHPEWRAA